MGCKECNKVPSRDDKCDRTLQQLLDDARDGSKGNPRFLTDINGLCSGNYGCGHAIEAHTNGTTEPQGMDVNTITDAMVQAMHIVMPGILTAHDPNNTSVTVPMSGDGAVSGQRIRLSDTWAEQITVHMKDASDLPDLVHCESTASIEPFRWNPDLTEARQAPEYTRWFQSILSDPPPLYVFGKEVSLRFRLNLHPSVAERFGVTRGSKLISGKSDVLFVRSNAEPFEADLALVRIFGEVKTTTALETRNGPSRNQAIAQLLFGNSLAPPQDGSRTSPLAFVTDCATRFYFYWATGAREIQGVSLPLDKGISFLRAVSGRGLENVVPVQPLGRDLFDSTSSTSPRNSPHTHGITDASYNTDMDVISESSTSASEHLFPSVTDVVEALDEAQPHHHHPLASSYTTRSGRQTTVRESQLAEKSTSSDDTD